MRLLFFILLISFIKPISILSQNEQILVKLNDIRNDKGEILYALYDNEKNFNDSKNFIKSGSIKAVKGSVNFVINGVKDGEYALSILHDENGNSVIDTNVLGVPKEGFGFSGNPKIFFKAPSFRDTKFMKRGTASIQIDLKYFL